MKRPITLLLASVLSAVLLAQAPGYTSHYNYSDLSSVLGQRSAVLQDGAIAQLAMRADFSGTALLSIISETSGTVRSASRFAIDLYNPFLCDVQPADDGGFFALYTNGSWDNLEYGLLRFDAQGEVQWAKTLHVPGMGAAEYGYSKLYELPNGHLRLSLSLNIMMLMTEMDATGNILWSRNYSGNIYVTGTDSTMGKNPSFAAALTDDGGAIITGKRENDGFLVRCAATGEPMWSLVFPSPDYTHIRAIQRLANGQFMIGGYRGPHSFLTRIDADGNTIWSKTYVDQDFALYGLGFESIHELENGELVAMSPPGTGNTIIVRTDASGEPLSAVKSRPNYLIYDLRLIDASNGILRTSGTLMDYSDYSGHVIEGVMSTSLQEDCEFLPLQVVAFEAAPITTQNVVAYSEPYEVTTSPLELIRNTIDAQNEDVCAMLVGIDETGGNVVSLAPTIVDAGEAVRVAGLRAGRHQLTVLDQRGAVVGSTTLVENGLLPTIGLASGIYTVRFADQVATALPLRFVVR